MKIFLPNKVLSEGLSFVVEEPRLRGPSKTKKDMDETTKMCPRRWKANVRRLCIIPPVERQSYVCEQLKTALHYCVDRNMMFEFLKTAFETEISETKRAQYDEPFEVILMPANKGVHISPGGFLVVFNGYRGSHFPKSTAEKVLHEINSNGSMDEGRRNFCLHLGNCGNRNTHRTKESYGIPVPNLMNGTRELPEVFDLITTHIREYIIPETKKKKVYLNMYCDSARNEVFANQLGTKRSDNCAEAVTAHKYSFKTKKTEESEQLHSYPHVMMHAVKTNGVDPYQDRVHLGENLLDPHRDLQNDTDDERYAYVVTMILYMYDEKTSELCRLGLTAYGKQVCHDVMKKIKIYRPLLSMIQDFLEKQPAEVKEKPRLLKEGETPYMLPRPHMNKPGIYYALFGITITRFLNRFQLRDPDEVGAGLCVISTVMSHQPHAWYEHWKRLFATDWTSMLGGRNPEEMAAADLVFAIYEYMFDTPTEDYGYPYKQRMQPFHNRKMTKDQLKSGIKVLLKIGLELRSLPEQELMDNIQHYYHVVLTVITMSPGKTGTTEAKIFSRYHVCGIHMVGPLSGQQIIGIATIIGLFPQTLFGHAEIPTSTDFRKIYDTQEGQEAYEKADHYRLTQDLLKAGSFLFDMTIAEVEEAVCQTKAIKNYEAATNEHFFTDMIFPGIPYLKFVKPVSKKTAFNKNIAFIEMEDAEGRKSRLNSPRSVFENGAVLKDLPCQGKEFFDAKFPGRQKNGKKNRRGVTSKPLCHMIPGSVKRNGQFTPDIPEIPAVRLLMHQEKQHYIDLKYEVKLHLAEMNGIDITDPIMALRDRKDTEFFDCKTMRLRESAYYAQQSLEDRSPEFPNITTNRQFGNSLGANPNQDETLGNRRKNFKSSHHSELSQPLPRREYKRLRTQKRRRSSLEKRRLPTSTNKTREEIERSEESEDNNRASEVTKEVQFAAGTRFKQREQTNSYKNEIRRLNRLITEMKKTEEREVFESRKHDGRKKYHHVSIYYQKQNGEKLFYRPNPDSPLLIRTVDSFVEEGYRYFADKDDAITHTCINYIMESRNEICHSKKLMRLWDLIGKDESLERERARRFKEEDKREAKKKEEEQNSKVPKASKIPKLSKTEIGLEANMTSRKRKRAIAEGDYLSGISSETDLVVFSFSKKYREKGRNNFFTPEFVAMRFVEGGYAHFFVDPNNGFVRNSGYYFSRPFAFAERKVNSKTNELQPFARISGHILEGKSVQLEVQWMDKKKSVLPLSQVARYAPTECHDYCHDHQIHSHVFGKRIMYQKTISQKYLIPLKGLREVTKTSLDLQSNLRLVEHKPISSRRRGRKNESKEKEKLVKPVENMTWKELGAPGCGRCRNGGCPTCYERVFGPTNEYEEVAGDREDNSVIHVYCIPTKIPGSFANCEVLNTNVLNCLLASLSLITSNEIGFTNRHEILKHENSVLGEALSLIENRLPNEARQLLLQHYPELKEKCIVVDKKRNEQKIGPVNPSNESIRLHSPTETLIAFLRKVSDAMIIDGDMEVIHLDDSFLVVKTMNRFNDDKIISHIKGIIGTDFQMRFILCKKQLTPFALIPYQDHLIQYNPCQNDQPYLLIPPSRVKMVLENVFSPAVQVDMIGFEKRETFDTCGRVKKVRFSPNC